MKLLIDIGNTRIKWATLESGELTRAGGFAHENEPGAAAAALVERVAASPDTVLVSNVAGTAFGDAMAVAVRAAWNLDARFAEAQPRSGRVRNAYRDHRALGVDRWLAILAVAARYPAAACIVDAGTAVTIDLVAADGEHLGGYIVPGSGLMRRALTADTGNLGRLTAGEAGDRERSIAPGRGTSEAIGNGSLAAICALIERCADRLAEDNSDYIVVITGGDAERIIPHLTVDLEHRPRLVLEGLAVWEPG